LLIKKYFECNGFGIFDRTHLRLFTQKSGIIFFVNAGFDLIKSVGINEYKAYKFELFSKQTFGLF
jgi:hypothetical protein